MTELYSSSNIHAIVYEQQIINLRNKIEAQKRLMDQMQAELLAAGEEAFHLQQTEKRRYKVSEKTIRARETVNNAMKDYATYAKDLTMGRGLDVDPDKIPKNLVRAYIQFRTSGLST